MGKSDWDIRTEAPGSYHSHPHLQRMESDSLSFFRSALQTAHDLIHIVLLPDKAACSASAAIVVVSQTSIEPYTVLESGIVFSLRDKCQVIVKELFGECYTTPRTSAEGADSFAVCDAGTNRPLRRDSKKRSTALSISTSLWDS